MINHWEHWILIQITHEKKAFTLKSVLLMHSNTSAGVLDCREKTHRYTITKACT